MRIISFLSARVLGGAASDWHAEVVEPSVIDELCELVLQVSLKKCNPRSHIPSKRGRADAVFVAVDATPMRWVIVQLQKEGELIEIVKWDFNDFREDKSYEAHCLLEPDGGVPIEVAEALAMEFGLCESNRHEGPVKVIGGDNLVASLGTWKGFSRSAGVQSVVTSSKFPKDCPVVFVDIPTDENLADVKTRPKILESKTKEEIRVEIENRKAASWRRLYDGYKKWRITAKTFYHRDNCVYDTEVVHKFEDF